MTRFLFILLPFFLYASGPAPYVWSLGYAMDCDYTPFRYLPYDYETLPTKAYLKPDHYIEHVAKRSVIWVQEYKVKEFYRNVLPHINHKFVLVITDGDECFPSSYAKHFPVDKLILHPKVIQIFAQNVGLLHPKISPIPIGLDFHSIAKRGGCFGEPQRSVEEQVASLESLLKTLPPTHARKKKALVDFHLRNHGKCYGESRAEIFEKIYPSGMIDALPGRIPRSDLWKIKGEYAFSISPPGHGLDCHRTWEDLVLGCIVIVKTSTLDPLYKGLPVVIINDWSEVNEANFTKWLDQYSDAFTNPAYRERLTHTYWMNKIRKAAHKLQK